MAVPQHPYLVRKHLSPHCARQIETHHGPTLLIPFYDLCRRRFQGAQRIYPKQVVVSADGSTTDKKFAKHSTVRGCAGIIGDLRGVATALLAGGLATSATVHELTAVPVVIAFNAGNLAPIAGILAETHRTQNWRESRRQIWPRGRQDTKRRLPNSHRTRSRYHRL